MEEINRLIEEINRQAGNKTYYFLLTKATLDEFNMKLNVLGLTPSKKTFSISSYSLDVINSVIKEITQFNGTFKYEEDLNFKPLFKDTDITNSFQLIFF